MRIVHYSNSLSRSAGGLYYSVSGLAKALKAKGADIVVFGHADQHFAEDRAIWGDLDVRAYPFGRGRYGFRRQVLAAIAGAEPDILHIHGVWSAASLYGRLAADRNIPVVVSSRGMLAPRILAHRPWVKRLHAALVERPLLDKAHVHALNAAERQVVETFSAASVGRVFIVPNGIEAADEVSEEGGRAGILFLNRLHPNKQPLALLDAWKRSPGLGEHKLTIAGWGEPTYEHKVAAAAAVLTNVTFFGPAYGERKAELLRRARFFILPSLSEGMPMAVLQALQSGAVPIITDQCNLPELFRDEIAIRIDADFSDFTEKVGAALQMSEAEFAGRSRNARAYSLRYLWPNIATQMLEDYQRILQDYPRRAFGR